MKKRLVGAETKLEKKVHRNEAKKLAKASCGTAIKKVELLTP